MKANRIFCVVAYDIQSDKIRTRIAKKLLFYGTRANFSVFECLFTPAQLLKMEQYIVNQIDCKTDSVIFYRVCINCYSKTEYLPKKSTVYQTVKLV